MNIEVEHLTKRFGGFTAVDDVSFRIESGTLVALLGPSGSGKSTILRMLAGLEAPDAGVVRFDGRDATGVHARHRAVGFVFQHYALFRHLTVERNVAFGLEVRRIPRRDATRRARELLELVGLRGLEARYPSQLSGGQRQRVALARALAPRPSILLLDEPFGAVDAKVRDELRLWLRRLHDEVGVTSLFVTHDQDEAFSVSDAVVVVNRGAVEQCGTPTQILDDPATGFVAQFVGEVNVLNAEVRDGVARAGALRAALNGAARDGPSPNGSSSVHLVIRSHDLRLWREDPGVATVERIVNLGDRVRIHAMADGAGPLVVQCPRHSTLLDGVAPGRRVQVEVAAARAYPRPDGDGSLGRARP